MVTLEALGHAADGAGLVVAAHDLGIDLGGGQRCPARPAKDHPLQLVLGQESVDGALGIAEVIPKPMLVSVGAEDHRTLPGLGLQTVGVDLGLLLPDPGVLPCPLGLHHR